MSIKDIIEKIKRLFLGNETKKLPEGENGTKHVESRGGFLSRLRVEQETPKDMKEHYLALIKEFNEKARGCDIFDSKWSLIGNGVPEYEWPLDEAELPNFAEERRRAYIESSAKKGVISRGISRIFARSKWDDTGEDYKMELMSIFIESMHRKQMGESTVLSTEEELKRQEAEEYLRLFFRECELQGEMQGMRYAAYTHGLTTEENEAEKEEIEKYMEDGESLLAFCRQDISEKELSINNLEGLARIEALMDSTREIIGSYALMIERIKYDEARKEWSEFIEHGGEVNLDVFKTPVYSSIYDRHFSSKGLNRQIERGREIINEERSRKADIAGQLTGENPNLLKGGDNPNLLEGNDSSGDER